MYTNYFGLKEKPFSIALNPRFLYMSELHREALAHLMYGINSEGCIILLTGDVGTGKTTIYRSLIEQLPENTNVAIVLNPQLGLTDILKTICDELSIHSENSTPSIKSYIDSINKYLLAAHSRGEITAVIIDEAQNLDKEVLEHLRLLTNLETNTNKLLQIVLVGQPELRKMLSDPQLSQINQRVTARYHLDPLQKKDILKYIQHRLAVAGGGKAGNFLFTKKALLLAAKRSKGIPRMINLLCDRALLGAYVENKDLVDHRIMKKAAEEIASSQAPSRKPSKKYLAVTVFAIFLLSLPLCYGLFYFGYYPSFLNNTKLTSIVDKIQGKKPSSSIEVVEPQPMALPTEQSDNY